MATVGWQPGGPIRLAWPLVLVACAEPDPKPADTAEEVVDIDGDGFPADEDCADGDADINPGAEETCNGLDDDCDGVVDEDDAVDALTWYADSDGDGAGDPDAAQKACDPPDGTVTFGNDCDDTDAAVSPTATELCNGIDDDCDGATDEGDADGIATWYADADADGFGDPAASTLACAAPDGHVADATDCDDTNAARFPGAGEVCGTGVVEDCAATPADAFTTCGLGGDRSAAGADATIDGDVDEEGLAEAVGGGGDLTGDGVVDLVLGASRSSRAQGEAGAVFVVDGMLRGASDASAVPGGAVRGDSSGDRLGASVVVPGDIDGDGLDDLVVGAPGLDAGGAEAGAALVLTGPITGVLSLENTQHAAAWGAPGDAVGAVLAAGDLDGDTTVDLLLGAPDRDAVLVFLGPLSGTHGSPTATLSTSGATRAGEAVDAAGDLDGDGVGDLLVGAPASAAGATNGGAAWVIAGPLSGAVDLDAAATASLVGVRTGAAFGGAVRGLGDMNGDGHADIVVSAYADSTADTSAGAVHVFHGPLSGALTSAAAAATVTGTSRGDVLGLHLPGPADVDGDGTPDLVVGTGKSDLAAPDAGAVFLFLGPLSGTAAATDAAGVVRGLSAGDGAGSSVAVVGDVDADGSSDVLVGAPEASPASRTGAGAAYLLLGGGP